MKALCGSHKGTWWIEYECWIKSENQDEDVDIYVMEYWTGSNFSSIDGSQWYCFQNKICSGYFYPPKTFFLVIKMINFRGDFTDISAKTATLLAATVNSFPVIYRLGHPSRYVIISSIIEIIASKCATHIWSCFEEHSPAITVFVSTDVSVR